MIDSVLSRTLVTGGTGFVARRLISRLLRDGYRVRATHRGTRPADFGDEVEWMHTPDIGPKTAWTAALEEVDLIFHLAGRAHQLEASQSSLAAEYDRVNAHGTRQLAHSVVERNRPARIVLLSSIGAVCSTGNGLIRTDTPETPDTPYGRSKLLAETLLKQACRLGVAEWCVIRAPLVYGPGAPGNMQRLMRLVRRGLPLPLGRATARRSMIFVDNLVDALVACGRAPAAAGQTFLVADEESVSVAELVALMAQLSQRKLVLVDVPPRAVSWVAGLLDRLTGAARDANGRYARAVELLFNGLTIDTSLIRSRLDWRPPYSLREGLTATIREEGHA